MRTRYSFPQIVLHWAVVAMVPVQYLTGEAVVRTHNLPPLQFRPAKSDLILHQVHTYTGMAILALIAVRIFLRLICSEPSRPPMPVSLDRLRIAMQVLLYFLITSLAVTGMIATYFWFPIAALHKPLFWIFITAVVFHISAAIWHLFRWNDAIFWRITGIPRARRWITPDGPRKEDRKQY